IGLQAQIDQRMPDLSLRPNLIPLHAWLTEAGTNDVATETLFDEFCGRLAAAGVPIARGFLSIAGVHPLRRAYSLTWNYGRGTEATIFDHAVMTTAMWQASPFRYMLETKTRRLHRRLVGDDAVLRCQKQINSASFYREQHPQPSDAVMAGVLRNWRRSRNCRDAGAGDQGL